MLDVYGSSSGQIINFHKSSIMFSINTNLQVRESICFALNMKEVWDPSIYLGLPSLVGWNKKVGFNFVKDRVWNKLNSWNNKLLSKAYKEVLLKTIIQAMPNYVM